MLVELFVAVLVFVSVTNGKTDGEKLVDLINKYRQQNGLAKIPYSKVMMLVGQKHVENDVYAKSQGTYNQPGCNLHSWYSKPGESYSTCCYTSDHNQAKCMWDKPKQISSSAGLTKYPSSGYEISAGGYGSAAAALNGWKGSSGHNNVILNKGGWSSKWNALGCGVKAGSSYHCWFGKHKDPNPYSSNPGPNPQPNPQPTPKPTPKPTRRNNNNNPSKSNCGTIHNSNTCSPDWCRKKVCKHDPWCCKYRWDKYCAKGGRQLCNLSSDSFLFNMDENSMMSVIIMCNVILIVFATMFTCYYAWKKMNIKNHGNSKYSAVMNNENESDFRLKGNNTVTEVDVDADPVVVNQE